MSYIIQQNQALINFKLTELGREKIAQGQLTFGYWAIGDSEINYNREAFVANNLSDPELSGSSYILNPVDKEPELKYFITSTDTGTTSADTLNILTDSNIRTLKYVVNNRAETRGFFNETSGSTFTQKTDSNILLQSDTTILNGGNQISVTTTTNVSIGDFVLIKVGGVSGNDNEQAVPYLWYKIKNIIGTDLVLDRNLPNTSNTATYFIYKSGEVKDSFGNSLVSSYWDSNTLNFNSSCDISVTDVPVWNMNNVWDENLAGLSGDTVEKYENFGSYKYLGSKNPYFGYDVENDPISIINCDTNSVFDDTKKSVSIIHYTNNTISNFYGEFLYVNNNLNKTVEVKIPTLMYHRRKFMGTGSGTELGMRFIASGTSKTVEDSNIEYYDLMEDSSLVVGQPQSVGRVFPQYKMIVIDDEEIVAAISYKSNRNWTLPKVDLNLVNSNDGILDQNKTMYVTYMLYNDETLPLSGGTLPNQKYVKVTNTTSLAKDVDILIEDLDLLPYLKKIEEVSYDGLGFYANKIKIIYQILDDVDDRPNPENWKELDLTSNLLTSESGETINGKILESKNSNATGLKLNAFTIDKATDFVLGNYINTPLETDINPLQFGDERFFYGNIDTFIGATVYKTLFDINISANEFVNTTNPTKVSNPTTNIRLTELGIYDNNRNLVGIAKLSLPLELSNGTTITLEASIDF